jgi:hypothetical protein
MVSASRDRFPSDSRWECRRLAQRPCTHRVRANKCEQHPCCSRHVQLSIPRPNGSVHSQTRSPGTTPSSLHHPQCWPWARRSGHAPASALKSTSMHVLTRPRCLHQMKAPAPRTPSHQGRHAAGEHGGTVALEEHRRGRRPLHSLAEITTRLVHNHLHNPRPGSGHPLSEHLLHALPPLPRQVC